MFDLNQQEKRAVLFLAVLMLLGIGINLSARAQAGAKVLLALEKNTGRVDLNCADTVALVSVPGIGPKLAGRIIEYRKVNGSFNDVRDLKNIKGISGKKYEKLKVFFFTR